MFIRYYLSETKAKDRVKELIEFCKRTGCEGVLFFSSSYDSMPSFIKIEEYRKYAEKLKIWVEKIKNEGLKFGINILQTLGHIYFPEEIENEFPFQRKIDINGVKSKGGVCPLDENFRKYILEVYKIFAELKPDIIYVDDDFRYIMDGIFCFCNLHIERFEKDTGIKIKREELKEEILKETLTPSFIKIKYFEILNRSLKEVAEIIEKTVHSISPDTRIGLMLQCFPQCFWGADINEIIKKLSGNRKPLCRPQLPIYREYGADLKFSVPVAFSQPMIIKNFVDKDVEIQPEIENYPYSIFSKSKQIFKFQISFCYLNGFETPLLNIFDDYGHPLNENREFIDVLEKNKKFFNRLKEIGRNTEMKGISIPYSSKTILFTKIKNKDISTLFKRFYWERIISLLGLPLSYNWENPDFCIFSGNELFGMDDKFMEKMIKKGGFLIDKDALEVLQYKGFSEITGVKFCEKIDVDDCGSIYYHRSKLNKPYEEEYFPLRFTYPDNFVKLDIFAEKYEILASVVNFENKIISPAIVMVENKYGTKFGVFSFSPSENLMPVFLNPKTQNLIRNLFSIIGKIPFYISILNSPYVIPYYFEGKEGIFILILNLSSDRIFEIIFKSSYIFVKKFYESYLLSEEGKFIELKNVKFNEKEKTVKINYPLSPFEFIIIHFKKKGGIKNGKHIFKEI
jgi:hypothetical protein